jgi:hypothetical protein
MGSSLFLMVRALSALTFNHSLRWRHSCSVVKLSGLESQAIPLLRGN